MYLDKKSFSELITWLVSDGRSLFVSPAKGYSSGTSLVRIPVGDAVDAVFGANFYPSSGEKPFVSSEKLDVVGFFHKPTGVFYSSGYFYEMPDCPSCLPMGSVMRELKDAVENEATKRIRRSAEALKASASQEMRDRIVENDFLISRLAYARFFGYDAHGSIDFPKPIISQTNAVDYLNAPKKSLDQMVEAYLVENSESIVSDLILEDAVAEAYEVIVATPPRGAVIRRDIITALREIDAVNVKVTVENEDGEATTFPYPVDNLTSPLEHYEAFSFSEWALTASQRKELSNLFCASKRRPYCGSGFLPEEIKQITYKKKVLFQR